MATQVPGADNQSSTEQAPGPPSETPVVRHVDLNLNVPTPLPTYMLMQQLSAQSYSTYQHADSQQPQPGYVPGSVHGGRFYTAPQELHHGYQGCHLPVQEQVQGFPEQHYMQQVEGYVQSSQTAFETSRHQNQMQRILPRRLPHMRQRVRRRNRTNRSNIHSVAANMVYNSREHRTATSITGSMTSGPVLPAPVEIEESQERLSRLTSTVIEEASGIEENFECNICFQKANEAVVTCCGHLFCWPCLYRWLHVHSYHKECPVCKGSIAEYSATPIYGRENALASARLHGALGSERIPPRPAARRVESARQQQREREENQERTTPEHVQGAPIEQSATEIEEGEPRAPGAEAPSLEAAGEDNISQGAEIAASRLQGMEHHEMNELGEPTEHIQNNSSYLQRRLAFRQEQLRQALANSRYSAALNQTTGPGGERQQMLAASALLSQEWEHIINSSRLVADPTQAATWLASMHARLANNVEPSSDAAAQQRSRMIASAVSQPPQEDDSGISSNRLPVQPSQVSNWITTMRTRLNNIEQLMHNLERPHESIAMLDVGNPNSQLRLDGNGDDLNLNEFLSELNATAARPPNFVASEQNPTPVAALQPANESGPELRSSLPEAQVVRRSRKRRDHGEEASHVVAAPEEGTEPAPHGDQLPLTRKRRRRLD